MHRRGMGRLISGTVMGIALVSMHMHGDWDDQVRAYAEFPLGLPQGLDRPFMRVDGVEFVSENPGVHVEWCLYWMLYDCTEQKEFSLDI